MTPYFPQKAIDILRNGTHLQTIFHHELSGSNSAVSREHFENAVTRQMQGIRQQTHCDVEVEYYDDHTFAVLKIVDQDLVAIDDQDEDMVQRPLDLVKSSATLLPRNALLNAAYLLFNDGLRRVSYKVLMDIVVFLADHIKPPNAR